jgi:hypothetical protein
MRVGNALIALVASSWILSGALHAQGKNVFQEEDNQRIGKLYTKMLQISNDLFNNVNYSITTPTIDETCRRTLDTYLTGVGHSLLFAKTLVAISSQMTSDVDEAIVNRHLKPGIDATVLRLKIFPGVAESVSKTQPCRLNTYIMDKAIQITELSLDGTALLTDFQMRLSRAGVQ